MRKIMLPAVIVWAALLLLGCARIVTNTEINKNLPSEEENYPESSFFDAEDETTASGAPGTANEEDEDDTSYETQGGSAETATPPDDTRDASASESESNEEIDLSIEMPEPNGTMAVSVDAENKYIDIVVSQRHIDSSLLAAVYSVPESGQNYVFEFYSGGKRTADNIRRVFFINSSGEIESVAASNAGERENISATENWFSMNVLIKKMIFPAVQDRM